MRAADILGVDTLRFIEPEFSRLADRTFNAELARMQGDQGRMLIDEHENPLALAFHDQNIWTAGTFLCRMPSAAVIGRFEEVPGDIYQEDRAVWAAAVREYYSLRIAHEITPAVGDLNPARLGILEDLITGIWGRGDGTLCLDFCCGSGVGSHILRGLGYSTLSCDNDMALLSLGFSTRRLRPEETVCIDATRASEYIEPLPRAIGIMMGEINDYSKELWEQLVVQIFTLADDVLITVGTEKETELIRIWAEELGRTVAVSENPNDPIYDRWVCVAKKK